MFQNFKQQGKGLHSTAADTTARRLDFTDDGKSQPECICSNNTDKAIYVVFSLLSNPVTAVVGEHQPVLPGAQIVLRKDANDTVSYVADGSATGRVIFTPGTGS